MTTAIDRQRVETLGPAERVIRTLLTFSDHMVHNRPGVVTPSDDAACGVVWAPATWKQENAERVVYRLTKVGKTTQRRRLGVLGEDGQVTESGRIVCSYRTPGLFPEVAVWMYRQVADVYRLDNDFGARWASWAFAEEHRDLKVVLAAFMLVQDRCGEPVRSGGQVIFHDEDLRAVGEAMCLLRRRDGRDLNPKLVLRVGDLLALPGVAQLNRELGFGRSARSAATGRYDKAVTKWLRHRERNVTMLEGLVKAGYRSVVMKLARRVGYKPESERFFEVLRWKQKQAGDGRRELAIGKAVAAGESWEDLTEAEICRRIVETSPNYKRIVGLLPKRVGLTRAVMAAAIEAGSVSDADLVILTPTLEDLGLLAFEPIAERWMCATQAAENQRAANIASRVRSTETAKVLQDAADTAIKKAVADEMRGVRVYVGVDISASMNQAIEAAKRYLTQFLQGFPQEKLTVCVFNTSAREVTIRHASAEGVAHAFRGFRAGGGTLYGTAVSEIFRQHMPAADEDAIFLFVGDQQQTGDFSQIVVESGMSPVAFGLLYVPGSMGDRLHVVETTADRLGIPCFKIGEETFADPYAPARTLRRLIAAAPPTSGRASGAGRQGLVETILTTPLLQKPVWA